MSDLKPESLHIVTNGGSTYAKVYLGHIEVDAGDTDMVMERALERLGVTITHDRDDMSLPPEPVETDGAETLRERLLAFVNADYQEGRP